MNDERPKSTPKPHSLSLSDRCQMSISGVEDVESFDETEIVMQTSQGNLIVRGGGLHIEKISLDVGELKVEGLITELLYEQQTSQSGSFWSRLFG